MKYARVYNSHTKIVKYQSYKSYSWMLEEWARLKRVEDMI